MIQELWKHCCEFKHFSKNVAIEDFDGEALMPATLA